MKKLIMPLALTVILLSESSLRADIVQIRVTGIFDATQVDDESGLNVFAPLQDQSYSLTFSYDSSVPDSADNVVNIGDYHFTVPPNQFRLTSGNVTLSDLSSYRLNAYWDIGGTNSNYALISSSTLPSVMGLTLPSNIDSFGFGFIHPVSATVVDFLDNGVGNDPLPAVPFFLGVPTDNAYAFVDLSTYDAGLNVYYDDSIYASVTSIQVVPEPSSFALWGLVGLGLVFRRSRKTVNGIR
jgi:hypothetical protein